MEPELQRVEIQPVRRRDDDLAVHDAAGGQLRQEGLVQFRKVAVQRPEVAALDKDVRGSAEHDRAKSVPFRFVQPAVPLGQRLGRGGKHRLNRRRERTLRRRLPGGVRPAAPAVRGPHAYPPRYSVPCPRSSLSRPESSKRRAVTIPKTMPPTWAM